MATLDDLRREIRQRAERIVRAGNIRLQADLRQTSPKVTRRLERATTVRVTAVTPAQVSSEVVVDVEYAEPVIRGARPHPISPKKAGGWLAFKWDAAPDFVRRLSDGRVLLRHVNHPGNEPNSYFDDAVKRWGAHLQAAADRLG